MLPNVLVPGIANAIEESRVKKIYVCNVAIQKGETDEYTISDHVEASQRHSFPTVVDYAVANDTAVEPWPQFLGQPVVHDGRSPKHVRVITEALVDGSHPARHDSTKLAQVIMDVYHRKRRASAPAVVAKEE